MTFDPDCVEMNLYLTTLLCLSCFTHSRGQVTVEVREFENVNDYTVLTSYTFPSGFSNPFDWFTEPYTHLPSGGLTGVLSHPEPNDACSPILGHLQTDFELICSNGNNSSTKCTEISQYMNISRIAIVDGYHTCTTKKLENIQDAGFDAMITFSVNDMSQAVTSRVYDQTMNTYVDIPSKEFPVVVVSKAFASVLIANVTFQCSRVSECHSSRHSLVVVHIESNDLRQGWVQFGISVVLVLLVIGVPILLIVCVCLCCYCMCNRRCKCSCCDGLSVCRCWRCCCRKSGAYEVHELQVRELGHDFVPRRRQMLDDNGIPRLADDQDTSREQFRLTFENPRACVRREFDSEKENSVMCAICLEEFTHGEEVDVLPCDDNHIFHVDCIAQWLESQTVCPVCRSIIVEPSF